MGGKDVATTAFIMYIYKVYIHYLMMYLWILPENNDLQLPAVLMGRSQGSAKGSLVVRAGDLPSWKALVKGVIT